MGTSDEAARIAGLEEQLLDVNRRLTALERAAGRAPAAPGPPGPPRPPGEPDDQGVITYSGDGRFGFRRLVTHQRIPLSEVLAVEPSTVAPVFAAFGSPARIGLLRALIGGPQSSQQLREVLDAPSAGQLYHHLRELLAAGLVIQPNRSVYAIPMEKIVAVCVALSAAVQLTSISHQAPPPAELPEEEATDSAG